MTRLILFVINIYQKTISPDHGFFSSHKNFGTCKFYPSCSEYSKRAVLKKGLAKGLWLATKRVMRCHPFSLGGFDPVD
jgi:uncharacterized protein